MTPQERAYKTHVIVRHPEIHDRTPQPILLDVGDFVFLAATYADDTPEGVIQVGDGRSNSYDIHGNRILSYPAEWCTFLDEKEAEDIAALMKADAQLLSYARG